VHALARVDSIPGWLRPEDADKLWELAASSPGPILEIGTYRGKSAVLMALALRAAQRQTILYTLDIDAKGLEAAAAEAQARGVGDIVVFVHGTVREFARAYPHVRPALTFVDGDHARAGVERDLAVLESLVPASGLLVFHDFADPRNDDPDCHDTKVRPAVQSSWVARQCDFVGTFGVCGLFVRRDAPPQRSVAVADILALGSLRDRYSYGLRFALARRFHRVRRNA
jgi:predicted O-methyltransferase YrrM